MNANSQILQAAVLGNLAFASGVKCAPCLDGALMEMLSGRQIGETPSGEASTASLMTAWQQSWTAANLGT